MLVKGQKGIQAMCNSTEVSYSLAQLKKQGVITGSYQLSANSGLRAISSSL